MLLKKIGLSDVGRFGLSDFQKSAGILLRTRSNRTLKISGISDFGRFGLSDRQELLEFC